jgi:hypothetical protein
VLEYQFDCLLWRNDIVSILGKDGPRMCCVHDGIKHHWINTFGLQIQLISGHSRTTWRRPAIDVPTLFAGFTVSRGCESVLIYVADACHLSVADGWKVAVADA